jgi:hypothetical protein
MSSATADAKKPLEVEIVGNYKLERVIGQGTYGKVRLGINQTTNEKVHFCRYVP